MLTATRSILAGKPDLGHVLTSFVERQNLTMRMAIRRFTRLTNRFSKTAANHEATVALHFMVYNFVRIYQALRATPVRGAKACGAQAGAERILTRSGR